MNDSRAIGIFDSGIGGLTVLSELATTLPHERFVYLGDTARVPYGAKSKETVVRYSLNNLRFLEQEDIKAVVVACNTASAYALDDIAQAANVPVIGVVEGGVRAALRHHHQGAIGVIGTEATIGSGAYEEAIRAARPGEVVRSTPCPLFVALAEEGWSDNDVTEAAIERYLGWLKGEVDTLILGCTHYPVLSTAIARFMGPHVTLVDSAHETANLTKERLGEMGLLVETGDATGDAFDSPTAPPVSAPGGAISDQIKFYVTDSPARSLAIGRLMVHHTLDLPQPELVDII